MNEGFNNFSYAAKACAWGVKGKIFSISKMGSGIFFVSCKLSFVFSMQLLGRQNVRESEGLFNQAIISITILSILLFLFIFEALLLKKKRMLQKTGLPLKWSYVLVGIFFSTFRYTLVDVVALQVSVGVELALWLDNWHADLV